MAALVDRLSAQHLDALLVTGLPNIRYLTGFSGSNALLLVTARDVQLVTDFRYQTQVAEEVAEVAVVRSRSPRLWSGLWNVLGASAGVSAIGFESAHMPHRDFQRLLEPGERWQWRPATELVERLRELQGCRRGGAHSRGGSDGERALRGRWTRSAPG